MDAKELTKVINNHSDRITELEKTVKYLENELQKQRMLIGDMRCDIMELERSNK